MADLVTLADPTSPYSFLNYLKETGRLYPFYIRESFYPLRAEYNDYCRWAAAKLPQRALRRTGSPRSTYDDGDELLHRARRPPTATGQPPRPGTWCSAPAPRRTCPTACAGLGGDCCTTRATCEHQAALQAKRSITVVGSGQSAAEIYHDLLADIDAHGYQLNWVTRSPRFFPLEYTKLTLEMTSPEYVGLLPRAARGRPATGWRPSRRACSRASTPT